MSETFRKFLRTLPDFPDNLPTFDPEKAPQDPTELFKQWLDEALAAGELQPHAFSLATAGRGPDGSPQPSSRMLILKNIDGDGWHFATSRSSRKGRELAAAPQAAMNFYWPSLGRQVRVAGPVAELSAEATAIDWWSGPPATAAPTRTGSCTRSGPLSSSSGRPAKTAGTCGTAWAGTARLRTRMSAMTDPAPEALLAALHKAAADVTNDAATLTDDDVKAPSALQGWTRGHVLAHLAGIANAMARQLEFAARGETVELYDGGMDGRNRAIEMAAGHDAATHRADVAAAISRALHAFDALPGVKDSSANSTGWWAPIAYRGGVVLDGGLALWRELTIHAADLLTGRGPETWSRPFCEHLFGFLAARVQPGDRLVLQPLGLQPVTLGSGARSIVVNGMITDIAAWLAGREPTLGSLRASANADGTDLPELLPWPAATPAPR